MTWVGSFVELLSEVECGCLGSPCSCWLRASGRTPIWVEFLPTGLPGTWGGVGVAVAGQNASNPNDGCSRCWEAMPPLVIPCFRFPGPLGTWPSVPRGVASAPGCPGTLSGQRMPEPPGVGGGPGR